MKFEEYSYHPEFDAIAVDESGLNAYVAKVFGWTFLGLLTTAAVVLFFVVGFETHNVAIMNFFIATQHWFLGISIVQIAIVFAMSFTITRMNPFLAKFLYLFYSFSMGLLFTWIALFYDFETIGIALLITGISFGGMCFMGLITKKDLTSMGSLLTTALLALVIGMFINFFLQSDGLDFLITIVGIVVFLGLAAFKANNIKRIYKHGVQMNDERFLKNMVIFSALGLYITFINLLLMILRLLGRRD